MNKCLQSLILFIYIPICSSFYLYSTSVHPSIYIPHACVPLSISPICASLYPYPYLCIPLFISPMCASIYLSLCYLMPIILTCASILIQNVCLSHLICTSIQPFIYLLCFQVSVCLSFDSPPSMHLSHLIPPFVYLPNHISLSKPQL